MVEVELIIDADSHITATRDVWTSRVPSKLAQLATGGRTR
jgi:hypothetical protein